MSDYIDLNRIRETVREIEEASEALSAAQREAQRAASQQQSDAPGHGGSASAPGPGHQETANERAAERARREVEKHRSTLQSAVQRAEGHLDDLNQAIRGKETNIRELEDADVQAGRGRVADAASEEKSNRQKLVSWRRKLNDALDSARQMDSAGSGPSTPSASAPQPSPVRGPSSRVSLDEQLNATPAAQDLESKDAFATPPSQGRGYGSGGSDRTGTSGPEPALGRGSSDGGERWFGKLFGDEPTRSGSPGRSSEGDLPDQVQQVADEVRRTTPFKQGFDSSPSSGGSSGRSASGGLEDKVSSGSGGGGGLEGMVQSMVSGIESASSGGSSGGAGSGWGEYTSSGSYDASAGGYSGGWGDYSGSGGYDT
jgi:hypothetical protein